MKTFVIITPVPTERVRVTGGQLDFGAAGRIDPSSRAALVLALGFSDDVTALAIEGQFSDDALHEALAYGAKRAVAIANPNASRISDALAEARLLDRTIYELATYEAAVVFCGTGDDTLSPGVSNPVGAAITGMSYFQYIGGVEAVKAGGDKLEITTRNGSALLTITEPLDTLLMLGVSNAALGAHTLPWAGGIINAYREGKVETMSVDVPDWPTLTLNQLAPPPKRDAPEILTEAPAEAAAALVEMLRSRAII